MKNDARGKTTEQAALRAKRYQDVQKEREKRYREQQAAREKRRKDAQKVRTEQRDLVQKNRQSRYQDARSRARDAGQARAKARTNTVQRTKSGSACKTRGSCGTTRGR